MIPCHSSSSLFPDLITGQEPPRDFAPGSENLHVNPGQECYEYPLAGEQEELVWYSWPCLPAFPRLRRGWRDREGREEVGARAEGEGSTGKAQGDALDRRMCAEVEGSWNCSAGFIGRSFHLLCSSRCTRNNSPSFSRISASGRGFPNPTALFGMGLHPNELQ